MPMVLILSPYFPPSTLAGVHRARLLAKHLPAHGWRPTILCVDEAYHEQRLDPDLAALVPPETEIIKVSALPVRYTRPFGIGEITLRSWRPLRRALFRRLAAGDIDVVLITGAPFFPMMLAGAIKKRFGVPVVLDFQDPWVSAWGARQPALSKAGIMHRIACRLEPRAVRHADFITSVSETQNDQMAARYPWLDRERMAAIPIGGDPEDFAALRKTAEPPGAAHLEAGKINISYVGTFMPRTGPLMEVVFRALARLREREPSLVRQARFNFIGTSNQPNDATTYRVRPLAEAAGVAALVHEVPQRLPFLEALGVLAQSDAILLVGSDEPHYTASKIYPALMSGRPHLSLFHAASSAHAILARAGGGLHYAFADAGSLASLEETLADGLAQLITAPEKLGTPDPAAYAPYAGHAVVGRYGEVFDKVSGLTQAANTGKTIHE